jgi:hypothetical protein
MKPLDLDTFRLKRDIRSKAVKPNRPPRHKAGEWFIKGPIPGGWLVRASGLSGRALRVGLVLWYLAGLKKSRTVKPTWDVWRLFELCPDAGRRGLLVLEQAGLIEVERAPGCCPEVTILEG